jgi:hypothetical protein
MLIVLSLLPFCCRANEPELEALQGIPFFYPILRSSINVHSDPELFDDIDPRLLTRMCTRYEVVPLIS